MRGRLCPACGADVGFWSVVRAGTPDRVRCRGCGARLRYERTAVAWVALVAVVVVAGGAAVMVAADRPPLDRTGAGVAVFCAAVVALAVPVELAVTWYVRRAGVLATSGPAARA